MPQLVRRWVEVRVEVRVLSEDDAGAPEKVVGEFAVTGESPVSFSDGENVQGLVKTALERAGKKARAMAAGVDNNESARLK